LIKRSRICIVAGMALVSTTDLEASRVALQAWLGERRPEAEGLVVSDLDVPTASGFSNETIFFDVAWRDGEGEHAERLVARLQTDGPGLYPVYDIGLQHGVMRALQGSGVAVPKMLWLEEDASILGAPFFVMERLDGRVPADDPPFTATGWVLDLTPDERARLCDNGLRQLVAVHAVDPAGLDLDVLARPELGDTPLAQELAFYRRYYEWAAEAERLPVIESAFAWLSANQPAATGPPVISWGDARIGNMMFGERLEVVGVLDWEMAAFGAPEQDLGWWLFMHRHHTEGFDLPHPEGFPRREEVIARYEELSGRRVENVAYYEVLAALRGAVIMVRLARMMTAAGLLPADSGMAENNGSSRILADLLGLPAPRGAGVSLISKAAPDQLDDSLEGTLT
jgi:aminoglycoside phosphotransferase (APT) family kinase protein